ncbi:MAG: hypothetical protein KAS72_00755 [Phycisphaerales bacterium]|nr:hypothetical protein [Phycisphaerales bacterium]
MTNPHDTQDPQDPGATREQDEAAQRSLAIDILICRIVDHEAAEQDWAMFRSAAAADGSLWRSLAEAQAAQRVVEKTLEPVLTAADALELPAEAFAAHGQQASAAIRWPSWGGWAAAAAVALAWWINGQAPTQPQVNGNSPAQQARFVASPADVLGSYLQFDHVVGQGEPQVLNTLETETGTDVLMLRPIYERIHLGPRYETYVDEEGRLLLRRIPTTTDGFIENAL